VRKPDVRPQANSLVGEFLVEPLQTFLNGSVLNFEAQIAETEVQEFAIAAIHPPGLTPALLASARAFARSCGEEIESSG